MTNLNLFGEPIATSPKTINHISRPINDWAYCLYILMDSKKGITAFDAAGTYGIIKFQERINEIGNSFDGLLHKEMIEVRKRIRGNVKAMRYKVANMQLAFEIYAKINVKGGSKILKKTDNE